MAIKLSNLKRLKKLKDYALYKIGDATHTFDVDCSNLPLLTSIGVRALGAPGMVKCDISNNPNLADFGNLTFNGSSQLLELSVIGDTSITYLPQEWINGDRLLTIIHGWSDISQNLVRVENHALSNTDALTLDLSNMPNLQTVGIGAFQNIGQITNVDWSNNANLISIGNQALQSNYGGGNRVGIVGDVNLSGCTNLVSMGDMAFYGNKNMTHFDASGCTALETIGTELLRACYFVQSVSFKNCSSLQQITRGFMYDAGNLCESVDFTGCVSLAHIGQDAFYKFLKPCKVGWLDDIGDWDVYFPHEKYPLLEDIGPVAFNTTNFAKFNFTGLIGTTPLQRSAIWGTSVAVLEMPDCKNATQFGVDNPSVQTSSVIQTSANDAVFNFSGWDNCTKIAERAIDRGNIKTLGTTDGVFDLDECFPNLETIGAYAFCDVGSYVIKCTNGNLTSIGEGAFGSNNRLQTVNIRAWGPLTIGALAFTGTQSGGYGGALTEINLDVDGELELCDRCFSSLRGRLNLNNRLDINIKTYGIAPTIKPQSYISLTPSASLIPAIMDGCAPQTNPLVIHFTAADQAIILAQAREYEDAATDGYLNYFCTSNGDLETTTGGSGGNIAISTKPMYECTRGVDVTNSHEPSTFENNHYAYPTTNTHIAFDL